MSTKVTIQDIANELQLSRNTVSKAINNTGICDSFYYNIQHFTGFFQFF